MKKIFLVLFVLFPFLVFAQGTGIVKASYTRTQADARFAPAGTSTSTVSHADSVINGRSYIKKFASPTWTVNNFASLSGATFIGNVSTPVLTVSSTDTVSGSYAVGSMFLRIVGGDTSMWVKIRLDGPIEARWKKLTP